MRQRVAADYGQREPGVGSTFSHEHPTDGSGNFGLNQGNLFRNHPRGFATEFRLDFRDLIASAFGGGKRKGA
jgi:hypothetical protein